MITWAELAGAEPRLAALEEQVRREAATAATEPAWSFSAYWSYILRPAIKPLIGWERDTPGRPELCTEDAWCAAASHLIGLLPAEEDRWAS